MLHRTLARGAAAMLAAALLSAAPLSPARAAQGSGCMPTSGVVSGLVFAQDINAALAALISSNSGASVPVTDCSAATIEGQIWYNTSGSNPFALTVFDSVNSLAIGYVDKTNHFWTPPVGGGLVTNTIASAATVDLGSVKTAFVQITGSTGPITSFGSSAQVGTRHTILFQSTPTINNGAALIIPGGVNVTAAAGDLWEAIYLGGGNWRVMSITLAAGAGVRPKPITCVILSSGATTICSDGVAYAVNGVFTPKAGATRMEIREVGGGGGGGGNGTGTTAGNGVSGGISSFNGVIAGNGGNGGANSSGTGGSAGAATIGSGTALARLQGMAGAVGLAQSSPAAVLPSTPSGGTGLCPGQVGGTVSNNCGAGGVGASSNIANVATAGSGGGGELVDLTIANPSGSYAYAVGTGGAGGTAGTSGGAGSNGIDGRITVKMFFD